MMGTNAWVSAGGFKALTTVLIEPIDRRDQLDEHTVCAEATGCPIRIIRWFFFIIRRIRDHIIPENLIGTAGPVVTSFAAIGYLKLAKSRRQKKRPA